MLLLLSLAAGDLVSLKHVLEVGHSGVEPALLDRVHRKILRLEKGESRASNYCRTFLEARLKSLYSKVNLARPVPSPTVHIRPQ